MSGTSSSHLDASPPVSSTEPTRSNAALLQTQGELSDRGVIGGPSVGAGAGGEMEEVRRSLLTLSRAVESQREVIDGLLLVWSQERMPDHLGRYKVSLSVGVRY